ncbi:MAG: porin [Rhodospirillales bacterium]|nr:porin [Rhodospirillales bacterium]
MKPRLTTSICAALVASIPLLSAPPAGAQTVEELRRTVDRQQDQIQQQSREINELRQRLDTLARGTPAPQPATNVVTAGAFPGSIKLPETDISLKIGGYVKLDAIHDFDAINSEFTFPTSAIPLEGTAAAGQNGRTILHARESRFNIDARSPSALGVVRAYVEGDFYGAGGTQVATNSFGFRLRHAYGEVGNFTAGQTWTTFMDVTALPETLDFQGVNAQISVRQGQVRWTQPMGGGMSVAVAVENPEGDISGGSNLDQYPDFAGRWRMEADWGHFQAGGLVRQIANDSGPGTGDEEFGWGLNVSTRINLPALGKDNIRGQLYFGNGIGRYVNDLAAAGGQGAVFVTATSSLEVLESWGGYASFQHHWNPTLRSNATYGYVEVDNVATQAATAFQKSHYLAANVIWNPVSMIDLGAEWLWGKLESNGAGEGEAHRLQLATRYRF